MICFFEGLISLTLLQLCETCQDSGESQSLKSNIKLSLYLRVFISLFQYAFWMKFVTRKLYVQTQSKEEERLFLQMLDKYANLPSMHITSKLGRIVITLTGTKDQEIKLSRQIRDLIRGVKGALYADRKGRYFLENGFLAHLTGGSVSSALLVDVINQLGFSAERTEYGILTTMPYLTVLDHVSRIEAIRSLLPSGLTKPMRSILIATSLRTGWRPLSLLDAGYVLGLFRDNSQGTAEITQSPDSIIASLSKYAEENDEFPDFEGSENALTHMETPFGEEVSGQIVFKKSKKSMK